MSEATPAAVRVLAAAHRARGLSTAVKAASILDRLPEAIHEFRTGGSDLDVAILRSNTRLGYVVDEHWLSCAPPGVAR
jgi:hypothetical protein